MIPDARNPTTGLRYVQVIPSSWGPFVDIHACYTAMARRYPWISVISPHEFEELRETDVYQDPMTMFVQWAQVDPWPKERRQALVTLVYSEAISTDQNLMLPDHVREWNRFFAWAPNYDAAFAHTPWMVEQMAGAAIQGYLLPVGWDPEAMGAPRFSTTKHKDAVFYGSHVGKRALVMPFLREKLGNLLDDVSGCFGRTLSGTLDNARASLYVAHSDVDSFSTWRLWQTAATSAALIAEPGDCWPFARGVHFVPIERITFSNIGTVAEDIRRILHPGGPDLLAVAKAAHEVAREFTVDNCVAKYLVPASAEILARRPPKPIPPVHEAE